MSDVPSSLLNQKRHGLVYLHMKEMLAHLELLRVEIADYERLQEAATSQLKRDVCARTLSRYRAIAAELEQAIARLPPALGSVVPSKNRYEEK